MIKYKEKRKSAEASSRAWTSSNVNARVVALIAASATLGGSLGAAGFNYLVTERHRTQIAQESLEVQRAAQLVSEAAQKTLEQSQQIAVARLEFEKQVQLFAIAREDLRTQISHIGVANDSRRTENDSVRTRVELAKQLRELRPSLLVNCFVVFPSEAKAAITCNMTNTGVHTWILETQPIEVVDKADQIIPNVVGKVHGVGANRLPPGGKGSNFFQIDLNVPVKELSDKAFKISFNLVTDEAAREQVRLESAGILSAKRLVELSSYSYSWRIWLN
ncbi:hypothetical protein [Variovorax sp. OV084]|uniref:hypothetical protein n=1 Tax=Variovorax sp. OV084 TaxID=1882777 RepID=UPI0008D2380F|nr:hypothetical protein [Variovorax sp. OV084]SES74997.1 hypothetical protein SAMN05443580_101157 [Variovorax sp. OV084]